MAYTDVGDGPPLVFLHGNPTSARLFRPLLRALSSRYRCIAPDYLGFGRSEAPPSFSYRPPAHATQVEALLRGLDLRNLTLVCHDWGGPIGVSYALRHPATVRRLVLMNTWAWPLTHRRLVQAFARLLDTPPGRIATVRYNAFARLAVPLTTGVRSPRAARELRSFADALDTPVRRRACWTFARSLRTETTWLRALWTHRDRLRGRPTLLCWGLRDPAFGTGATLERWRSLFPDARLRRFPEAGHYLPVERRSALTAPIRSFLADTALGRSAAR